ncbi:MAG TPA: hypothetical protein VER55_11485, partial [Ardenticatenaceae bacterium]|nr:hypothetical protein [Ardenticatenaceae bacterium]
MPTDELRQALESHPLPVLRAIAASHGLETHGERESLIDILAAHLVRPETIARTLAGLGDGERGLLDRFIAAAGRLPSHRVQRDPAGGELRQLGGGALERLRPWETPSSSTERLWYLGLIYLTFDEIGDFSGPVLFVPKELLDQFPPVEQRPPQFAVELPEGGAPAVVRTMEPVIVADAFAALSEIQRHPAEAVERHYLPPAALQRLNRRLRLP